MVTQLPTPPTPVLLYLGAGYDLSPLITFSPSPPYQIAPHSTSRPTYTSFLLADAKPRHTSAFMVPDFAEWIDVPARVRNIVRYSHGMLDRWRLINQDLIWFEGGGSSSHRRADPAWNFVPLPASALPRQPHHAHEPPPPLVTLIYAFNTLDIELAAIPALANVWPCVHALYVHGLRPYPITGLDRLIGPGQHRHDAVAFSGGSGTHVQRGLQHVYVIVGSWGTPRRGRARGAGAQHGVRNVDFVRAAWKQWRRRQQRDATRQDLRPAKAAFTRDSCDSMHSLRFRSPESYSDTDADSGSASDSGSGSNSDEHVQTEEVLVTSPLVFRRGPLPPWDSESGSELWSSGDSDADEEYDHEPRGAPTPGLTSASTLESQGALSSYNFSYPRFRRPPAMSRGSSSPPSPAPFYTRIPQIAWSDALHDGRGGYFVSKTVAESLAVWRSRREGPLETESEDSEAEGDEDEDAAADAPRAPLPRHPTHPPPPRRPRSASPRLPLRPRPARTTSDPVRPTTTSSDTDVSRPRARVRPFWRRGRSLMFPRPVRGHTHPHEQEHEHDRLTVADFLRAPVPSPGPAPVPRMHYPRRDLRTLSCPDLNKDTTVGHAHAHPHPAHPALRALAALRRRANLPRLATAPPSPSLASARPEQRHKTPRSTTREEPAWLGRLIGVGGRIRPGTCITADACELDAGCSPS